MCLSHVLEIVEESDSSYKTYLSAYVSDIQSLIVNKVTNIAIIFCHATILQKKYELANLLALFCFDCRYRAVLIQASAIKTL